MSNREVVADTGYVDSSTQSVRTAAILAGKQYTDASVTDLVARIANATPYNPAEAISSPVAGTKRVFGSGIYLLTGSTPGGIAPLGAGDGSPADQALLVQRVSGHAAQVGVNGGQGGVVRTVTTSADDPNGTTSGSLRSFVNEQRTRWLADQTSRMWIVFDPAHGPYNIVLTAKLNINFQNITFDGRAASVNISGGGLPGPIPYGSLNGAHSAATTGLVLTLKAGFNFSGARLQNGMPVDIISADGTRANVYATNLKVASFDSTAGTVTLDPSTPLPSGTMPTNATLIYRGKSVGQVGFAINNGGESFNDVFGPGLPNIPAGNIIWCDIAVVSNWGGDVMDTGNKNDFRINNWTNGVWIDHCTFSNPDPFHDVMFQNGSGAWNLTVSWCYFHDHYKAINHFNGTNGSGGVDPSGQTSKVHSFPPKPGPDGSAGFYTTTDPGPYRWDVPPSGTHGNTAAAPLTVETATWHHNKLYHLGNRSPKCDFFSEFHFYNNWVKEWGLSSDPNSNPPLVYDWYPAFPLTGGSALQCINWANCRSENNVFEPYADASKISGGGPKRAIAAAVGNGARGYITSKGDLFLNGATVDTQINDGQSVSHVPDFSTRYIYTLDDAGSTLTARIDAGAGANVVSALWVYQGPFSVSGGGTVTDNGDGTATA